jgi:hypothetical protein
MWFGVEVFFICNRKYFCNSAFFLFYMQNEIKFMYKLSIVWFHVKKQVENIIQHVAYDILFS